MNIHAAEGRPDLPLETPATPSPAARVVEAARRTWRFALVAAAALLVVALAVLAVLGLLVPTTTTYLARIQFVFPDAASGRYPNGLAFTINELIDPAVLTLVYDQFELEKLGVKRDEFYHAFAVRQYLPTEAETIERYRQALLDRRLTFPERQRLEEQLRNELDRTGRSAAELSMTLRLRNGLPPDLGRAIVLAVPLHWSQLAIEQRGVLRRPGFTTTTTILDEKQLQGMTIPTAVVIITDAVEQLSQRLGELRATPGFLGLRDPQSGWSMQDVQRNVNQIRDLHGNNLLSQLARYEFADGGEATVVWLRQRISELQLKQAEIQRAREATREAISQFVTAVARLKGRAADTAAVAGEPRMPGAAATVIPQLSESFIDRLIELTRREGNENEVVSRLVNRELAESDRLNQINAELDRLDWVIRSIRTPDKQRPDEQAVARINADMRLAAVAINSNWATLTRMEEEFALKRNSHSAHLYRLFALPNDIAAYHPILNGRTAGIALLLVIVAVFLAWLLRLGVELLRGPQAPRPGR